MKRNRSPRVNLPAHALLHSISDYSACFFLSIGCIVMFSGVCYGYIHLLQHIYHACWPPKSGPFQVDLCIFVLLD